MAQEISVVQVETGPPNPKAGVCYVKIISDQNDFAWKAILCEWKEFVNLEVLRDDINPMLSNYDEHYINRRVRELLDRNLSLEIESYYSSSASDTTDVCLAKARAIIVGEYLKQQGLDNNQLKITVLPVKDSVGYSLRIKAIDAMIRSRSR